MMRNKKSQSDEYFLSLQLEKNRSKLRSITPNWSKKGQEEIVGFVLIMLVVAVIFVIFIGILIKQRNINATDEDPGVAQFLDAMMEYTSDCTLDGYSYKKMQDLIIECSQNQAKQCKDGRKVCDVFKTEGKNLIQASWNFDNDLGEAYSFKTEYKSSASPNSQTLTTYGKVLGEKRRGSEKSIATSNGKISVRLEFSV